MGDGSKHGRANIRHQLLSFNFEVGSTLFEQFSKFQVIKSTFWG